MTDIAITAKGLTRYFGKRPVVNQIDFQVPTGSVTGLLGLNGAGKTTTLRMLMGLLEPTRGTCSILGVETHQWSTEHRARIGYTFEGHFLYSWMRLADVERFQRGTFPKWDGLQFREIVSRFGIAPDTPAGKLSRGQRAGVSLAMTLSTHPEVLVLDDPALGLDPISRRALNETLLEFVSDSQRTILISTHLLDDVERIADRILIMVDGRILVDSSIEMFRERVSVWTIELNERRVAAESIPGLVHAYRSHDRWQFTVVNSNDETEAALMALGGSNLQHQSGSFDESVVSYLSRSRTDGSFLRSEKVRD
ncbi:MAG: ABC transporter ATP-binding protein [Pirellula sp.]